MPRLFFDIRTSEEQRTELRRAQNEIVANLDKLHANYKPENIQNSHCTLRFLGSVELSEIKPLIVAARVEIERSHVKPFELTLDQCGAFSKRGKARVIWTGLAQSSELFALRDAIDRAVMQCAIKTEASEVFHPHLTLIRFREPFRIPSDFEFPDVNPITSKVHEIELVESRTLPTEPVHEGIARFAL